MKYPDLSKLRRGIVLNPQASRDIAKQNEDLVRKALLEADEEDVLSRALLKHPQAVVSTCRSRADWIERDPYTVYVFTEYGIGDPYDYDDVYSVFNDAVSVIEDAPWVERAGWESYKPGVAYFWIEPSDS